MSRHRLHDTVLPYKHPSFLSCFFLQIHTGLRDAMAGDALVFINLPRHEPEGKEGAHLCGGADPRCPQTEPMVSREGKPPDILKASSPLKHGASRENGEHMVNTLPPPCPPRLCSHLPPVASGGWTPFPTPVQQRRGVRVVLSGWELFLTDLRMGETGPHPAPGSCRQSPRQALRGGCFVAASQTPRCSGPQPPFQAWFSTFSQPWGLPINPPPFLI